MLLGKHVYQLSENQIWERCSPDILLRIPRGTKATYFDYNTGEKTEGKFRE